MLFRSFDGQITAGQLVQGSYTLPIYVNSAGYLGTDVGFRFDPSTLELLVTGQIQSNGNVVAGNVITSGTITTSNTDPAIDAVTGAVQVAGGIGVTGNVYVGDRVGFVAGNGSSAVYQIYNDSTGSLDTIFG